MHYVISYDLENDRLREKTSRLLLRHGAERIQKSVFVAAHLTRRDLGNLRTALRGLMARFPAGASDSIVFFPLEEDQVSKKVEVLGNNSVFTFLEPLPRKIIF